VPARIGRQRRCETPSQRGGSSRRARSRDARGEARRVLKMSFQRPDSRCVLARVGPGRELICRKRCPVPSAEARPLAWAGFPMANQPAVEVDRTSACAPALVMARNDPGEHMCWLARPSRGVGIGSGSPRSPEQGAERGFVGFAPLGTHSAHGPDGRSERISRT